jgi:hypothetical protein
MRGREPIMPQWRRHIPTQFSWVDHRLVRDGHIEGRSPESLALYLFLVTVADAEGMSWYSETALCRILSWEASGLCEARGELRQAGLIAYRKPLYQVLDLSVDPVPVSQRTVRRSTREAVAIGETLGRRQGEVCHD